MGIILVPFPDCDQVSDKKQLKLGQVYFGSQFNRYNPSWQKDMEMGPVYACKNYVCKKETAHIKEDQET